MSDFEARAYAIVDKAVDELVALASERYNEQCDCGAVHELAASAWVLAYEHVDMREGADPMAFPEVIHSQNSNTAAAGLFNAAATIALAPVLPHFHGGDQ